MKVRLLSIFCALLISLGIQAQNTKFESATEAVKNMKIGWNLVNTLDSYVQPEEAWFDITSCEAWETAWGNLMTKPELLKMIRKAGFNTMRIPVTWFVHADSQGNIDAEWMKRVHEVVDYVIDQGMYCILNTHHDTGYGYDEEAGVMTHPAKLIADPENYRENKEWFENVWRQIANEFKDYDQHLLFEGYNEMTDKTGAFCFPSGDFGETHVQEAYDAINDYAQSFVNAVRSTGGNNLERNLVVNTYSACVGPVEEDWCRRPYLELKMPNDVTMDHIIFGIHCYWMDNVDDARGIINNVNNCFTSRGVPTIISEYGTGMDNLDIALTKQASENGIAPIIWNHDFCDGVFRQLPAFNDTDKVKTALKAFYGDWYEPTLLTTADYDDKIKVTFKEYEAELGLFDGNNSPYSLDECIGFRVVLKDTPEPGKLQINAWGENGLQTLHIQSKSATIIFDKSQIGEKLPFVTLQSKYSGSHVVEIDSTMAIFTKEPYTERSLGWNHHDCDVIYLRKQFVHTVEYDYQWAELNIFYDDIPLKLKNYKGIRLELAEMPKDVHVKVYGDGEQKEEYIGIDDASSTILFNTDIFSREINRVTLQYNKEDKGEAKVISAWLIRQDGTEEYSDLSPFHGCEITKGEKYVPEPSVTIAAKDLTMTYGDDVPELTYTAEGGDLNGTPKLSTTATKTSPVGTYPIKVERGTVANTQATFVDGTLTITQAPLTVGVQDVTITEGDDIPTFTLTYDGWRNNDSEATAFTKKPTAKTTATNKSKAGTYTITVSGGEAKNYKLSYQSGTLTIKENGSASQWTSLVLNGDLEGNDVSCFYSREDAAKNDKIVPATIVDGAGKNNSRGIVIHSTDNPHENWNTQFFIRLTNSLPAGTKYRISLDYKASQNADVPMECHAEPGDYIYWDFGSLTFTKPWKHYEIEGTITAEQSTAEKKMHSIAFNLANIATATTYYFDNIVFEIYQTTDIKDINADNQGKTVIYNLGGQRLSKPQKGINIINGKKVFKR